VRKYKLGLYFALRFYLTMQQQQQQPLQDAPAPAAAAQSSRSNAANSRVSGPSGLTPRQSLGGFARSEGLGAEPQQLEQWLLSLVLGHATATLQDAATATAPASGAPAQLAAVSGAAGSAAAAPAAVLVAAEACVCTCLLLSRTDVLFGRVFALFAQKGSCQSAGALGALIETVELAVLSDLVQGLAPEVMQVSALQPACIFEPQMLKQRGPWMRESSSPHLITTDVTVDIVVKILPRVPRTPLSALQPGLSLVATSNILEAGWCMLQGLLWCVMGLQQTRVQGGPHAFCSAAVVFRRWWTTLPAWVNQVVLRRVWCTCPSCPWISTR